MSFYVVTEDSELVYRTDLNAANVRIEQLEERLRGADALIVLWETRATRAEARVEKLEAALREIAFDDITGASIQHKEIARVALAQEK